MKDLVNYFDLPTTTAKSNWTILSICTNIWQHFMLILLKQSSILKMRFNYTIVQLIWNYTYISIVSKENSLYSMRFVFIVFFSFFFSRPRLEKHDSYDTLSIHLIYLQNEKSLTKKKYVCERWELKKKKKMWIKGK